MSETYDMISHEAYLVSPATIQEHDMYVRAPSPFLEQLYNNQVCATLYCGVGRLSSGYQ